MAVSSWLGTLGKGEFKITCNGKTITISLSVHKAQHNVFTVEKEPEEWFSIEIKKLDDRTCQYCEKEFQYPCRLIQHMKAKNKCNNSASTVNVRILSPNNSDLTVNNSIQSMNNSILAVSKIKLE